MKNKLLYIIPHPTFYTQCSGIGGHLSHLYGIVQSFTSNNWCVDILIGDGHSELKERGYSVLPKMKEGLFPWIINFHFQIKKILNEGTYDLIYMRYSMRYSPFIPSIAKNKNKIPLVLEINSLGSQRYNFFKFFDKRSLANVQLPFVVSNTLKEFIIENIDNSMLKEVLVLTNGVDPKRFKEKGTKKTNEIKIGYVGVLKQDYGLENLLNAFSYFNQELPESKLIIIGDGSYKSHLENSASSKNINFIGAIPYDQIPNIISTFDILVYTTSLKNRFQSPIKIYEYMCTKIPIVAARTPLTSKLIPHRKSSLLYEIGANSEKQIYSLMLELIKTPSLAKKLANSAYSTVTSKHTWDKKVETILNELKKRGHLKK